MHQTKAHPPPCSCPCTDLRDRTHCEQNTLNPTKSHTRPPHSHSPTALSTVLELHLCKTRAHSNRQPCHSNQSLESELSLGPWFWFCSLGVAHRRFEMRLSCRMRLMWSTVHSGCGLVGPKASITRMCTRCIQTMQYSPLPARGRGKYSRLGTGGLVTRTRP